jgi:DNA mismatch repair ATPase MutS
LLIGVSISWAVTGSFLRYISEQHQLISKKQAILDQYAAVLAVFNTIDTRDSALLQEEQTRTSSAHRAIRRLSQLASFFDQRLNVLVNIFLNSFLLYDLHVMAGLEKWKETYKANFHGWIDAVGNIESLNSLASLAFNNPEFIYPAPVQGQSLFISATQLAHPLIPAAERVANDCAIGKDQQLILVTGSNMSGKTTFLRTAGVNLLLAQCGAPVCAGDFSFTPMQLLTSLRVSDSLQEHTSYFMAELKKLQRIIHHLQEGTPSLVLIDEILRGTNSEDKTYGSEQFIRKLLQYPCLSFFATHDLSLGSLEKELPGLVSNYCFESIISGDELHFDYRLRQGIARNRNASFLMKKMDII